LPKPSDDEQSPATGSGVGIKEKKEKQRPIVHAYSNFADPTASSSKG